MTQHIEPILAKSSRERRSELGQFLTPPHVAEFMASIFESLPHEIELLDAGAGVGALTSAVVKRACDSNLRPKFIHVTAYELDFNILDRLQEELAGCQRRCSEVGIAFTAQVNHGDFIAEVVPTVRRELMAPELPPFNLAIVNPPYRKIQGDSMARNLLRAAGIETVNLYTAFLALIARLLAPGGELVSITPRSFCNGPYYRPFRHEFLHTMALRRLHVFESRTAAFRDDQVLQENVIVYATKSTTTPKQVIISTSSGAVGSAVAARSVDYQTVVKPGDAEQFMHLPMEEQHDVDRMTMMRFDTRLEDLGLTVSTGRVVDYRAADFLRPEPEAQTAPLIYPCHFNGGFIHWPLTGARKPNAIVQNDATDDLLVPAGIYVLVKRFTAKEERRRLTACIYNPQLVAGDRVGFENHLNYFHMDGRGMSMSLAKGLAAFLNATVTDSYFRQFSGHTQVNATDLRSLRYPNREALERLGNLITNPGLSQTELDELVGRELFS